MGKIKPKIIVSNKEINSYNSNPTVVIRRSAMPYGQSENSKTIKSTIAQENNSINTVNTKGTKFIPIRNHQFSSLIRSPPLRQGIYSQIINIDFFRKAFIYLSTLFQCTQLKSINGFVLDYFSTKFLPSFYV